MADTFNKNVRTSGTHQHQIADNKQSLMNGTNIQSSNSDNLIIDSMDIQRTGSDYVVSGRIVNAGGTNSGDIRLKLRVTSVDTEKNLYETTFTPSPSILGSNQYVEFSVPFTIKGAIDKFDYQVDFISK